MHYTTTVVFVQYSTLEKLSKSNAVRHLPFHAHKMDHNGSGAQ